MDSQISSAALHYLRKLNSQKRDGNWDANSSDESMKNDNDEEDCSTDATDSTTEKKEIMENHPELVQNYSLDQNELRRETSSIKMCDMSIQCNEENILFISNSPEIANSHQLPNHHACHSASERISEKQSQHGHVQSQLQISTTFSKPCLNETFVIYKNAETSNMEHAIIPEECVDDEKSFLEECKMPPIKRRKTVESEHFFSCSQEEGVDFTIESKNDSFFDLCSELDNTRDLFASSITSDSPQNDAYLDQPNSPEPASSGEAAADTSFANEDEIRSKIILNSVRKETLVTDSSYRSQYITKISATAMNTVCKLSENSKCLEDAIESSFEYLMHKRNSFPEYLIDDANELILERRQEDVSDEDPFSNETDETFKVSFLENPTCVCSTPEKDDEPLDRALVNLSFENDDRMINTHGNCKDIMRYNDQLDQNDTEKEESSAPLTHISCSISAYDNAEFDLTELFNIQTNVDIMKDHEANNETRSMRKVISFDARISEDDRINSLLLHTKYTDMIDASTREESIMFENRKAAIMGHIENIFQTLIEASICHKPLTVQFRKIRDWKDCTMENGVLSQKITAIAMKTVSFRNKNSRRTFTVLINLLGEIYKMLSRNTSCTKRELYYLNLALMSNQVSVNKAIESICILLNVQSWELGVLSTSKGLVAGDITITTEEGEIIECKQPMSVPQNPSAIKSIVTSADYILVVEKDTVFTRLIEEKFLEKSKKNCILVTAKGYPDVNTRVFLRKITDENMLPVYALVDADPYGIEIMCIYKYGSLELISKAEHLALANSMEWIGIHPSDIELLDVTHTTATAADLKKVDELLQRPYLNPQLKRELECMKSRKFKAEIESLYHYSIDYFIEDYIPRKIAEVASPMDRISQQARDAREYSS